MLSFGVKFHLELFRDNGESKFNDKNVSRFRKGYDFRLRFDPKENAK